MADKFKNVDGYIESFPAEVGAILQRIRETVRGVVPESEEAISYGIPTVLLDGKYLVYFAGWKEHVSLYPLPKSGPILEEIAAYRAGKGTFRLPLDRPIPYDLIKRMVGQLVRERNDGVGQE